jgi:hypothetical protein
MAGWSCPEIPVNEVQVGGKRAGQGRRAHLIDEDHGEGGLISVNPLPSDVIASACGPSIAIAGSEDLVGASGGDEGKECEERTHVEAKRGEEHKGKGKGGRREDERYKRKERGFVEGWPT